MIPISHVNYALDMLCRTDIRDDYFRVEINPIPEVREWKEHLVPKSVIIPYRLNFRRIEDQWHLESWSGYDNW